MSETQSAPEQPAAEQRGVGARVVLLVGLLVAVPTASASAWALATTVLLGLLLLLLLLRLRFGRVLRRRDLSGLIILVRLLIAVTRAFTLPARVGRVFGAVSLLLELAPLRHAGCWRGRRQRRR